jgi:hypothetical protein
MKNPAQAGSFMIQLIQYNPNNKSTINGLWAKEHWADRLFRHASFVE